MGNGKKYFPAVIVLLYQNQGQTPGVLKQRVSLYDPDGISLRENRILNEF